MAREIVVLCDPCLAENVRSTGRSIEIAVDGKPRSVELCETHEAELLKPLLDVLGRFGSRVTAPPRQGRPAAPAAPASPGPTPDGDGRVRLGRTPAGPRLDECIVCGETYASTGGLARHLHVTHNAPTERISSALGDRCPLCGVTLTALGLGRHTGAVHRLPMAQAFLEARTAGDPFGVVAERVEVLTRAR